MDKKIVLKYVPVDQELLDGYFSSYGRIQEIIYSSYSIQIYFEKSSSANICKKNFKKTMLDQFLIQQCQHKKKHRKNNINNKQSIQQSQYQNVLQDILPKAPTVLIEQHQKNSMVNSKFIYPIHVLNDQLSNFHSYFSYQDHKECIKKLLSIGSNQFVSTSNDKSIRFYCLNQRKPIVELSFNHYNPCSMLLTKQRLFVSDRVGYLHSISLNQRSLTNQYFRLHNTQIPQIIRLQNEKYCSVQIGKILKIWTFQNQLNSLKGSLPIRILYQHYFQGAIKESTQIIAADKLNDNRMVLGHVGNFATVFQTTKMISTKLLHAGAVVKVQTFTQNTVATACRQKALIWDLRQNIVRPSKMFDLQKALCTMKKISTNSLLLGGQNLIAMLDIRKGITWKNEGSHSHMVRDIEITGSNSFISGGQDNRILGWQYYK